MSEQASSRPPAKTAKSILLGRVADDMSLWGHVCHEFGLERAASESDVPVVCCLVRDGAYWLPAFLDHYRKAGVREFFFLDNGSEDDTLRILQNESGVGVYSVPKPFFKHFNANLRRILIRMVRPQGWTLGVDIDEFFDFPFSNKIGLTELCRHLDNFQYDCMSTHMLDMFPEGPINEQTEDEFDDPRTKYPFYSLAGLEINTYKCTDYVLDGIRSSVISLPSRDWKFYSDGLRFRKFGSGLWLTKHALFKMGGRLTPFHHSHLHLNVRIANISAVLYHYKFPPHFCKQVESALRERQYWANSSDYNHYGRKINSGEKLILKDSSAQRLKSVNELLDQSFLDAPDDFLAYFDNA